MKIRMFFVVLIGLLAFCNIQCSGSSATVAENTDTGAPPSLGALVVEIALPIDINEATDLTYYGAHHGSHPEGLDHTGFTVNENTSIISPARGYVTNVSQESDSQFKVTIEHSDVMASYLDHLGSIASGIAEGALVEKGTLIGYPQNLGGIYTFDFGLADGTVSTGPTPTLIAYHLALGEGSMVSPFLYMNTVDRQSVQNLYNASVSASGPNDYCDYNFENEIFTHVTASIVGPWVATATWQEGGYPEMITFKTCDNTYHSGNHTFVYVDRGGCGGTGSTDGQYEIDATKDPKWITLYNAGHYGIYEITQDAQGELLKIEWGNSQDLRPASFSLSAATYRPRGLKINCDG